jgi:hypothetical protein
LGKIHRQGLYRGSKKGRDPNDPGMGSKMPPGRDFMELEVQNWVAKGRRVEYQVFS